MVGALVTMAVLAPACAGVVALPLARTGREAGAVTVAADVFALVVWLALLTLPPQVATLWQWAPELGLAVSWRVGPATLALALLVNGVGAVVQQYAVSWFGGSPRAPVAIAGLAVFQSAMTGVVLADDLLLLYVFWELTAVCSFALILTDAHERDDAYPAAVKALLVTTGGGLCLLVAVLLLGYAAETTSLTRLLATELPASTRTVALALLLPAALTKSAQFPFHAWLPAAMVAPTPVSALLHSATMVKAGVILLLYVQPLFADLPLWHALVPLGAVTCVLGSWRALSTPDLKKLLAWSTVSQLGLLVLTLGLGTPAALAAATLHLFAHALFKGGLFLVAGAVDHSAGTLRLDQIGGLWRRAPILAVALLVLGASMAGLPPTLGSHSKELVFHEVLGGGSWVTVLAAVGAVIGSVGTVAYTARVVIGAIAGRPGTDRARDAKEPAAGLLVGPSLLGVIGVAAWAAPSWLQRGLLEPVTRGLVGVSPAVALAPFPEPGPALATSGLVIMVGLLVVALLRRRTLPYAEVDVLRATLDATAHAGATTDQLFTGLRPTAYFAVIAALGFAPALVLLPEAFRGLELDAAHPTLWLVLLQGVVLAAMVRQVGQMSIILMVTSVGFTVALMFRAIQAPDLALTQLLVDMLTSVLLVLAIRLLGHSDEHRDAPRSTPATVVVSALCGLAAFAIVGAELSESTPSGVSTYYLTDGAVLAEGDNLVNLILTDFRALDTLGETLVVAVAAVGVAGLLRGREMPSTQKDDVGEVTA